MPTPLMPGDELVEPRGLVARMIRTTAGSSPPAMEIEWEVPAGRRLVAIPHKHPGGPERWRVVSGTARHWVGRRRLVTRAGEQWEVPGGTVHVHPANAGRSRLVVRQIIEPDPPEPELTGGVERYFETFFALAQRGGVDRFGRIKDPLQDALTLWEQLVPGSYIAGLPIALQRALIGRLAALARRRGYSPWLEAPRRGGSGDQPAAVDREGGSGAVVGGW
jgi:quercetin dioxygenase-like cupin family protein